MQNGVYVDCEKGITAQEDLHLPYTSPQYREENCKDVACSRNIKVDKVKAREVQNQ